MSTSAAPQFEDDPFAPDWWNATPTTGRATAAPMVVPRPANGLFSPSSWGELLYAIVDLVPTITLFALTVTLLATGVGLAVVYVGVPILAVGLLLARGGGHLQRTLAGLLLGLPVTGPGPIRRRRPGPVGTLTAVVTDPACWRAVSYFCLKIVLAPVTFAFAVSVWAAGLGGLTYPLWQPSLPYQTAPDGGVHRGAQLWPGYFVDTWPRMVVLAAVGAGLLVLAPRVVRFLTTIDRVLIAGLLGGPGRDR